MGRLNIELFKKVRDRIEAFPESYDQNHWYRAGGDSPCGTVCSDLAGQAIICAAPSIEDGIAELRRLYAQDHRHAVPERAVELLGLIGSWRAYVKYHDLNAGGETVIFESDGFYWPEEYAEKYATGDKAGGAVAYVDHIINTGEVFESE